MEIIIQFHINIPLTKVIQHILNCSMFMKEVLTKRKRVEEFAIVALTQECSQFSQRKLPPKLKDPTSFTIPCNIGDYFYGRALCDLGESINSMPLVIFKNMGI